MDILPDMAAKRAEISPQACAFVDRGSGQEWTFAEVDQAANGIAEGLRQAGLTEGDRLAILTLNCAEFFITLFACQKTGIILCPLNWRQPVPELIEVLGTVGPSAVIHDTAHDAQARGIADSLGIFCWSMDRLHEWIETGGPGLQAPIPAERPWYLLFTSGTTGLPKAVIQTARMSWANAVNIGQATGLTYQDRSVCFLPLFHTGGINLYTLPVFLIGATSTIIPKFDVDILLEMIGRREITQFFGVPAIYQALSLSPRVGDVDWGALRCGCGGAPLAEPLIRFFADLGVKVLNGFGMTETGPTVFLMDPQNAIHKIGSVGRAQMLTDLRLRDVAPGQPGEGEIHVRGPNITPGYYRNAEATEAAFTPDGWFRTGDIGRRDADGYIYIIDRIKDMFISGGENVYPAEVERVLNAHPAVLEAAVIGVPDERWGEVGAAFVLPRPDARPDPEALRLWCRDHIAPYKVPATVRVVADLPRTAAGKVRKPDLRKQMTCPSS